MSINNAKKQNWSAPKAKHSTAIALYFDIINIGKTVISSKKRIFWRVRFEDDQEHEITLTHSLTTGKKILRLNGMTKYSTKAMSFGDWDHIFNIPGGHVLHCMIKPSLDLNDMYDLIIDGVSFRRLPEGSSLKQGTSESSQHNMSQESNINSSCTSQDVSPQARTYFYSDKSQYGNKMGQKAVDSASPWQCTACTLYNEKGLAPICEACGSPRNRKMECMNNDIPQLVAQFGNEKRTPEPTAPTSESNDIMNWNMDFNHSNSSSTTRTNYTKDGGTIEQVHECMAAGFDPFEIEDTTNALTVHKGLTANELKHRSDDNLNAMFPSARTSYNASQPQSSTTNVPYFNVTPPSNYSNSIPGTGQLGNFANQGHFYSVSNGMGQSNTNYTNSMYNSQQSNTRVPPSAGMQHGNLFPPPGPNMNNGSVNYNFGNASVFGNTQASVTLPHSNIPLNSGSTMQLQQSHSNMNDQNAHQISFNKTDPFATLS